MRPLDFETSTTWFHGGFKDFATPDMNRSAVSAFHLASTNEFAHSYATMKSHDAELDADVIVIPFYVRGQIFDASNSEHLDRLTAVLPTELQYSSNYGWGAFYGATTLTKEDLLNRVQGLDTKRVAIPESQLAGVRSGDITLVSIDGGAATIRSYNPETDVVTWTPQHEMTKIQSIQYKIDYMKKHYGEDHWELPVANVELKSAQAKTKTLQMELSPKQTSGWANWDLMESLELRPYLLKAGFTGTLATERSEQILIMFSANNVARADSPIFKPCLHGELSGAQHIGSNGVIDVHMSKEDGNPVLHVVKKQDAEAEMSVSVKMLDSLSANAGLKGTALTAHDIYKHFKIYDISAEKEASPATQRAHPKDSPVMSVSR